MGAPPLPPRNCEDKKGQSDVRRSQMHFSEDKGRPRRDAPTITA